MGERAGVGNVHPHRFRRTFATWAIESGAHETDVMLLLGHIKRDAKEEKCTHEEAEYAQKYVQRAAEALRNLGIQAEAMKHVAEGKVAAFKVVVFTTKKMHDKATDHLAALQAHALQGERGEMRAGARLTGTHPGPSIRHQRDEEDAKAAESVNGNGAKKKKKATKAKKKKKATE